MLCHVILCHVMSCHVITRKDGGGRVSDGDKDGVALAVVASRQIGSVANDPAEPEAEREEDLRRRRQPNLSSAPEKKKSNKIGAGKVVPCTIGQEQIQPNLT